MRWQVETIAVFLSHAFSMDLGDDRHEVAHFWHDVVHQFVEVAQIEPRGRIRLVLTPSVRLGHMPWNIAVEDAF